MDMKAIIAISGPKRSLDIARRSNSDANGPVVMKGILEQIVIVANCRDAANSKYNVLGRGNIRPCQMSLYRISSIMFEKTQAVGVDVSHLADVKRCVEVGGVRRTIKAVDKVPLAGANAV